MGDRTVSVPESVALTLREEILSGALAAGERVKEESVEEQFSIGRHTARAALSLLVERGLLTHVRNHGASVPRPTDALVDEVFDYRTALELSALRLALGRGTDFGPVVEAAELLESLPPDAPWRQATAAHQRLHHAIVEVAGNGRLLQAYEKCEDELELLMVSLKPDYSARRLAELHRALVDAIIAAKGGDGSGALDALEYDIRMGRDSLHRRLAHLDAPEREATALPSAAQAH